MNKHLQWGLVGRQVRTSVAHYINNNNDNDDDDDDDDDVWFY